MGATSAQACGLQERPMGATPARATAGRLRG
jgi:hypothetical protein